MKELQNSPSCKRAPDLISFLYDEATEIEAQDFKLHLNECNSCRQELASFGFVREAITDWRDEALSSFNTAPTAAPRRKSAIAALRQFFDLSPLWLKGATAFAAVVFCVLAVLAVRQPKTEETQISSNHVQESNTYTQQDVDRIVKEALAQQEVKAQPVDTPELAQIPRRRKPKTSRPDELDQSRRPLSRAEREQLAVDLRLLSPEDEVRLDLLGDRINQ